MREMHRPNSQVIYCGFGCLVEGIECWYVPRRRVWEVVPLLPDSSWNASGPRVQSARTPSIRLGVGA
jgi:hypothetical protein